MNYEIQEAPEQTFAVIKRTVAFLRHPEGDAGVGGDRPELGGHDAARPARVHLVDDRRRTAQHRPRRRGRAGVGRAACGVRSGDAAAQRRCTTSGRTKACRASTRSSTSNCSATVTRRRESRSRSTRSTTRCRRPGSSGRSAEPLPLKRERHCLLEGQLAADREGGGEVLLAELRGEDTSRLLVQAPFSGRAGVPRFLAQRFDGA